ncbi:MAG: D-alanine--D-alanine ligase [Gammaproteobacteria bacterium]|nr:D-alanine--D-alanine ligase [Gammaproteobacteria bacterium]
MNAPLNLERPGSAGAECHPGMPPLRPTRRVTSFFEFWSNRWIYLPVALQWLLLALRYRSLSLPLLANPRLELGGFVGESKAKALQQAGRYARTRIAPYIVATRWDVPSPVLARSLLMALEDAEIALPVVAKPDLGCRGAGVQVINDRQRLEDYVEQFPRGARFLLQRLSSWQGEAGIFYVRLPDEPAGRIVSITLKYPPYVRGDGRRSLRQLILDDPRAGRLGHLYFPRHRERLDEVVPAGEAVRLAFAGSHCRGALFRNGNRYITPALTEAIDRILKDIPEHHYGRLDVRFADIDALQRGECFEIIEINGASSEATHIWDPDTRFAEVYAALFFQYRSLFQIGQQMRRRGLRPPGLLALWRAWRREKALVRQYPATD